MSQHIELDYKDPVHQGFFDPIQELLGASAPNFRLSKVNSTTIKVSGGTDNDQASIAINGKYRFRTTDTTAALPGGLPNGEHPVFVTGTPNDFTGPLGDIDEKTDYSFGLEIKEAGKTPATALYRQVGVVTVSGGAIAGLEQIVASASGAQIRSGAFSDEGDIEWIRQPDGGWLGQLKTETIEKSNLAVALQRMLIPTGVVLATSLSTASAGFLMGEGQAVSRTTYVDLFTLYNEMGLPYGIGDGTTTFNMPDYRGRTLVGKGTHTDVNALTDTEGLSVGSRTPKHVHSLPAHTHTVAAHVHSLPNHTHSLPNHTHSLPAHTHSVGTLFTGGPSSGVTVNAGSLLGVADNVHSHGLGGDTGSGGSGTSGSGGSGETGSSGGGNTGSGGSGESGTATSAYAVVNYMVKT